MKILYSNLILTVFIFISGWNGGLTQSLAELIASAHDQSPANDIAETRYLNARLYYQAYRAEFRPNIMLNATVPNLVRSISSIITDDGGEIFVNRSVLTNAASVSLNYDIRATGGQIYASTGLERLDILSSPQRTSYFATPIRIGFIQPISRYNPFTWQDKKEPVRLTIAEKRYYQEKEMITRQIVQAYFELMMAQVNLEYASDQVENNRDLLAIAQQRFDKGFTGREELLQLEINVNGSLAEQSAARVHAELATDELNSVLGNEEAQSYNLETLDYRDIYIDESTALQQFRLNNPLYDELHLSEINAEESIVEARARGRTVNIIGQVGFSQTNEKLRNAYRDFDDQEIFSLGIQVPITDWGLTDIRRQTAQVNHDLTQKTNAWEIIKEERSLLSGIKQFNLQKTQLTLLQNSMELAREHVTITEQRYLKGSSTINDLNLALENENRRRNSYYQSLREYWDLYYEIRSRCLYDFERNEIILYEH